MTTNVKPKSGAAKPAAKGGMSQNQLLIIIGVIAVVIVGLVIVIALSGQGSNISIDYASLNPQRTQDGAFIIGDPNAPITLVEFADWACPHCQEYHPTIQRYIKEFVETGRARFEFRMFPTAGGEVTVFLGRIAQCVDELQPGAFWDAYNLFFDLGATNQYTQNAGRTIAQRLNLSYSALLSCTENANQVTIDTNAGRSLGVTGTPAIAVRYANGPMQWINYGGTEFNRGSVSFDVLAAVTNAANGIVQ
ncbi:thioredoxin domain-containing protein [Kamptonema cortianum]|nr:thioredoxin domain-containing protein [Kamptonema cortianum]